MAQDTHRVHWQVTHGTGEDNAEPRDFVSLDKALRFIRDRSSAADAGNDDGKARLITDDLCVATFHGSSDGVEIQPDAISLVADAWSSLDDGG